MSLNTRIVGVLALALFLIQCKRPNQVSNVAYIFGPNDIRTIDSSKAATIPSDHLNSVVLVTLRHGLSYKFCSGTIVPGTQPDSNYRIITNQHCFTEEHDNRREAPQELIPNHCENLRVYFGFYKDQIAKRTVGECTPGSFRSDHEGDLAVFTLKENPAEPYKPATFWPDDKIPNKRKARIVHFPRIEDDDPDKPKKGTIEPTLCEKDCYLPFAQVTDTNCETVGLFSQDEWRVDKALGMGIKHVCDQKKGSSGSSLWDVETNTILGVNWGGISLSYGNSITPEMYNVATRAYYVQAFLRGDLASEKAKIALGKELPNYDRKISHDSNNTKKALIGKGCGTIGAHGFGAQFIWAFMVLLAPFIAVVRRR